MHCRTITPSKAVSIRIATRCPFVPCNAPKRSIPAHDGYQFGDLSKKLAEAAKGQVDKLGKAATGDANYEFGDLTRKLSQQITGDSNYRFGDLTRKVLGGIQKGAEEATLQLQDFTQEALQQIRSYEFGSITKSLLETEWGKEVVSQAEAAGRSLSGNPDYKLGDLTRGLSEQLSGAKDRAGKLMALPSDVDQLKQIVLEQQILLKSLVQKEGSQAEGKELMQLTGSVEELKPLVLDQQEVIDVLLSSLDERAEKSAPPS